MSLIWLLFLCQVFLGSVLCTNQKNLEHTIKEAIAEDDDVEGGSHPDGLKDFHDEDPHASYFSESQYDSCSPEEGSCNVPGEPDLSIEKNGALDDFIGPSAANFLIHPSTDETGPAWKQGSGWFPDWDLSFIGKLAPGSEGVSKEESSVFKKDSSVKVLKGKGDLERFLKNSHVLIVFFFKGGKGTAETLQRFLVEYDISSDHLLQYDIYLAVADCDIYSIGSYCNPEKVNRFAYGFRDKQEKIAFPLDTLFNNNAIVASALHLDLINTVPILQTAGERRELEKRCRGRCDIIFSFQRTLGTYEHRMFLEIAHAYQDSYVFAITTYTAGTLGLENSPVEGGEDVEQRIWVVHCADKTPQQQCVVSHFRRKMLLPELVQFLSALQLPIWHDLEVSPTMNVVITPYDGTSLPWVVLIYDSSCKHRVMGLAPHLAQLLHGSVATITLHLDRINEEALESLGLERAKIVTPALAFLHQQQEKTALLNDYNDPLEWVNEQLDAIFAKPEEKEDYGYQPVPALEELQQDDEMVMGMQREETFTNVIPLSGPESYSSAVIANPLTVVAFYLSWDPVSSMLLQHMHEIAPLLRQYGSQAALHRVNCFDWPKLCDGLGIVGYPELRISSRNNLNIVYTGPIHPESLMTAILLNENPPPLELKSPDEVERFLALESDVHPASSLLSGVAVGIFPKDEDSQSFTEAAETLRSSHLTGRYISEQAAKDMCSSDLGCVVISKPHDLLQPKKTLISGLNNSSKISSFLLHSMDYVLAPLNFQRLSLLWSSNGVEGSSESPFLILFFIPSESSLPHMNGEILSSRKDSVKDVEEDAGDKDTHYSYEKEIWGVVGRLATEFSEPGFVFSWIKGDEPLAEKLINTYQLTPGDFNLVGVNWRPTHKPKETKDEDDRSNAYVYTCPDLTPLSLRPWLTSLKEGLLKPSVVLGENDWEPRLPGFDYIKFMMEDEERDAEDHLIMEMESDLSSHSHRGDEGEGLLHMHKEF